MTFHANLNATHTTRPPQTRHHGEPHTVLPSTPWHRGRHWVDVAPRRLAADRRAALPADNQVPAQWFCELTWPTKPLAGQPVTDSGQSTARWLVVGDAQLAAQLGGALGRPDAVTTLPAAADRATVAAALTGVTHVLYAPTSGAGDDLGYQLFETGRTLASAAVAAGVIPAPRLYLLTRNAQPVTEGDRAEPAQAVLWGLGRTLALEHPEIWGAVIDTDASVPAVVAARWVLAEAHGGDGEDQLVYRAGNRHVARLVHALPAAPPPDGVAADKSHLVIGATGNIGPGLIEQLAASGAKTVVAVSRNPGGRLDELTARLAAQGTTVVTAAADAADRASLAAVFDRFGADLPPLGGVYLAAMSGGPITLDEMTSDDVSAMFRSKMDAVAHLHELSLTQPVDQFVLFTSISGVLGSRWLAHYAATTTFLDTFAFARRAAGLPACAINWGLWKSLADAQTGVELAATLESGLLPMEDTVALGALRYFLGPEAPARTTVVSADWPRLAAAYRSRAALHIVDDLLADGLGDAPAAPTGDTPFRAELRDCAADRRMDLLTDLVTTQVAAAMGLASAHTLEPTVGFFQFGMDSLMSVTLQRALSEKLGEVLPASVVFDYPTVEALTDFLASILPETIETAGTEVAGRGEDSPGDVEVDADVYDDLAEDELLARLSERLS